MATTTVGRGGGVDRMGLENLLGTNNHPMSGLSYSSALLGGHLLGVLPLSEGRFALFFKEHNSVESGNIVQHENKIMIVSTVSGGSKIVSFGVEDLIWSSFDSFGKMGYLLAKDNDETKIVTFVADDADISFVGDKIVPQAESSAGEEINFDSDISVVGKNTVVLSITDGKLFMAKKSLFGDEQWSFLSENTWQSHSQGISAQKTSSGELEVRSGVDLLGVGEKEYLFDWDSDNIIVYRKNRFGVWEKQKEDNIGSELGEALGFCLIKSIPAYSLAGSRYTIPAVISRDSLPISQQWIRMELD